MPDFDSVEQEIISIVAEVSGFDEGDITLDTDLAKDLEIDSIKAIEIVVALEKKYNISVRDEDVPKINSVKQIVDLTRESLAK